ncbi:MAG TPA: methyl-accepting chemotaxis protein [Terriglobales bacterium]|nr:methyl-accepting chemotaxis protein [Terriglobales bacterium]
MTIGRRLYLSFGALLVLVLAMFVVNIVAVQREHSTRAATDQSLQLAQMSEAVRYQVMQNHLYLRSYLLSGNPRERQQIDLGTERLQGLLHAAQDRAINEQQRQAFSRLHEAEHSWEDDFAHPLIEKRKQVDDGHATVADLQVFYLQLNPAGRMNAASDLIDEAEAANNKILSDRRIQDESASALTTWVSMLGAMLAVALGFVIAYRTSRGITEPLRELIRATREIGESGDLEHQVDGSRSDEIGELARTFNRMVGYLKEMASVSEAIAGGDLTVEVQPRSHHDTLGHAFMRMIEGLRSLVSNVRESATQVASGSSQVAGASDESARFSVQAAAAIEEVTSTMHEMSINVQNMVKNTQVQASSVSETSASIDQMVASIQRVADTAKVLLDISQRSREEVQAGIATMEKTTDGLSRINRSIQSSSEIIDVLGRRTEDIGKIVEVIDDLAEQTNLLALNAAIEAARAGEHGLGFAVVADEVRKLAEKSAQSTGEITELIQSIQRETRKAVENMEKSTGMVEEGLTMGTDLNTALRKISKVVTEVYKFAQEIGSATNEQSHGSSQIARATTRLNEITHEINSAVEEQASGAQGVVNAMERMRELVQRSTSGSTELAASAEQMSKMARAMLEIMDRFVLELAAQSPRNGNGNGHGRMPSTQEKLEAAHASRYAVAARS